MHKVAGGRNVEPWADKRAHVVTTAPNPVAAMLGHTAHDDPVAALKVGQGLQKRSETRVIVLLRPCQVAERVGHMQDGVWGHQSGQLGLHFGCIKVDHRLSQGGDGGFVRGMDIGHFLNS